MRLLICTLLVITTLSSILADEDAPEGEDSQDDNILKNEELVEGINGTELPPEARLLERERLLHSNPFFCSLRHPVNYQFCGGVMISERYALTASQCLTGEHSKTKMFVVVDFGNHLESSQWPPTHQTETTPAPPESEPEASDEASTEAPEGASTTPHGGALDDMLCWWSEVSAKHPHPNYDKANGYNDIGLVHLKTALPLKVLPKWPPIPAPENLFEAGGACDTDRKLLSWTSPSSEPSYAALQSCVDVYAERKMDDNVICTTPVGEDVCNFENGAPLICGDAVYGVLSLGGQCSADSPGVFVRVDKYMSFIQKTISMGRMTGRMDKKRSWGNMRAAGEKVRLSVGSVAALLIVLSLLQ